MAHHKAAGSAVRAKAANPLPKPLTERPKRTHGGATNQRTIPTKEVSRTHKMTHHNTQRFSLFSAGTLAAQGMTQAVSLSIGVYMRKQTHKGQLRRASLRYVMSGQGNLPPLLSQMFSPFKNINEVNALHLVSRNTCCNARNQRIFARNQRSRRMEEAVTSENSDQREKPSTTAMPANGNQME